MGGTVLFARQKRGQRRGAEGEAEASRGLRTDCKSRYLPLLVDTDDTSLRYLPTETNSGNLCEQSGGVYCAVTTAAVLGLLRTAIALVLISISNVACGCAAKGPRSKVRCSKDFRFQDFTFSFARPSTVRPCSTGAYVVRS